ncbi:hypothetical protein SDJN02_21660 [Cucurbita argyrosperma subsp. argyrosperma]|nr:hypothetical protein SDJN02_21660 [Cucurbita argyrosperma subsp. argyrosperma]
MEDVEEHSSLEQTKRFVPSFHEGMAPCTDIPVDRDPPATVTSLPVNAGASGLPTPHILLTTIPAASGSQIPSVALSPDALQQIIDCMVRNSGARSSAPSSQSSTVGNINYVREFIKFDPPAFDPSSGDIDVAYDWIRDLEFVFDLLKFPDEQRVRCAVFKLQGNARNWWRSVGSAQEDDGESPISWEEFKDMFLDWRCPMTLRHEKEMEFLNLKQGNMSVEDYDQQFLRLSRFAPEMVDTQSKMVHRFVMGLRKGIRGLVAIQNHTDYASAFEVARTLDECMPVKTQPGQDEGSSGQKRKHQRIA